MTRHPRLKYNFLSPKSRSIMIESRRLWRMARMQATGKPFAGPYYWVPSPVGSWELLGFAGKFYGDEDGHVTIWPEVVSILAMKWGKEETKLRHRLSDAPYGLPRGRVTRMGNQTWGVAHGNDNPIGTDLNTVIEAFNLAEVELNVFMDEHEHVIPEDVSLVRNALNAQYEIVKPPNPFPDESGDFTDSRL